VPVRLWGGRFSEEPDDILWEFTTSQTDRRLLEIDVRGSIAHVRMLGAVGVLTESESAALLEGLETIRTEATEDRFAFRVTDEDVHSAVERRLYEIVGDVAGKLHTGRSRNDQVVLDLRLYLIEAGRLRIGQIEDLARVLVDKAEEVEGIIVPVYTHMQRAQAIPLAHHLLAYAWMLVRDVDRLAGALDRIAVSPLGAGAAGGSSLPLEPSLPAEELGFGEVFENSLDAVASRDFVAEYTFCCAQTMAHLSRLAEELVLWATEEFGWVEFADRHCTGSSALPHKKNPDMAEHVRGRSARVIGQVAAVLALQKALPLTYNSDLQEDKEIVFDADDTLAAALVALAALVDGAAFRPQPVEGWVGALDLAEILVKRGIPFREAHEAVGRLIRDAEGREPGEITPEELEKAHPAFVPSDLGRLDAADSVGARSSPGGGSFESVRQQIDRLRRRLS
jgi:argininosuccinate lyase